MARNVEDLQAQREIGNMDVAFFIFRIVTFPEAVRNRGDGLIAWPVDGYREFSHQSEISTHVVMVVVGIEYGDESQFFPLQVIQHGRGITGIHYCGMGVIADYPDIIVNECANGNDVGSRHDQGHRQVERKPGRPIYSGMNRAKEHKRAPRI